MSRKDPGGNFMSHTLQKDFYFINVNNNNKKEEEEGSRIEMCGQL
jgi:hypothetical protein